MTGIRQIIEKWVLGRSMRAQLIATISIVLIPAFIVALLLIQSQNRSLQAIRQHTVEQSASLAAAQVDARLEAAYLLGRTVIELASHSAAADTTCTSLVKVAMARAGGWAFTLIRDGAPLCSSDPEPIGPLLAAARDVSPQTRSAPDFRLVQAPDPARLLMIWATREPDVSAVLSLPKTILLQTFDLSLFDTADGAAVLDASGGILARKTIKAGADGPDLLGGEERMLITPIGATRLRLAIHYPIPGIFALQNHDFWSIAIEFMALLVTTILGAIWAIDRTTGRWIGYFRRIAIAHSRGRLSVRAGGLQNAPMELADLGTAINRMAGNMADHARMIEQTVAEKTRLWQELRHRVKNNFQVVASLLSLHKKSLPPDRQGDIRFIEDHVQSMAIAYRLAYAPKSESLVPAVQLITEVIDALRETARIGHDLIRMESCGADAGVELDRAISLGLYLAYVLPPYLDLLAGRRMPLTISAGTQEDWLVLRFGGLPPVGEAHPGLRERLIEAYVRQLNALMETGENGLTVRIPLQRPASDRPETGRYEKVPWL